MKLLTGGHRCLECSCFPFAHTAKKAKVLATVRATENQALRGST